MKSTVLLPLYIFPSPHAWDPLYTAIEQHPDLQFLIIINPNSGPGAAPWWPNADYVREIPRLKAFVNVRLLGYVHATYCKRRLEHVCEDIDKYSARALDQGGSGLQMNGIFVDETVNLYSAEIKEYLDAIDTKVKHTNGFGDGSLVIHNPGTSVSHRLAEPGPDITVVVETSYAEFIKGLLHGSFCACSRGPEFDSLFAGESGVLVLNICSDELLRAIWAELEYLHRGDGEDVVDAEFIISELI